MAILHYEIPDDLHRALKVRAAKKGITLKQLLIDLLWFDLEGEDEDADDLGPARG